MNDPTPYIIGVALAVIAFLLWACLRSTGECDCGNEGCGGECLAPHDDLTGSR